MEKKRCIRDSNRGQISVFFIIGFILIILIMLLIIIVSFMSRDVNTYHRKNIEENFNKGSVEAYVDFCIKNMSAPILYRIGKNGGTLNESDVQLHSVLYNGNNYRLSCAYVEGAPYCINRLLTLGDMEKEISDEMLSNIDTCLRLDYFTSKGYNVSLGNKSLEVKISPEKVSFDLYYPIKLIREDSEVTADEFFTTVPHPLGLTYKLFLDIINHETTEGYFDKEEWMDSNNVLFSINKEKPYPNLVYSLSTDYISNFVFNFSLQLEDKASRAGRNYLYELEYGCCYIDTSCFKNSVEAMCKEKGGAYEDFSQCECKDNFMSSNYRLKMNSSTFITGLDDANCQGHKNGESWCYFENGVGARSILYSCHENKLYAEPCKDFQEEQCVDYREEGISKAMCKRNRWEDCTNCVTKECCENDLLRDCQWMNHTYKVQYDSDPRDCVPKMAPGFRFWDGAGQEVCNIGTKYVKCNGANCEAEWVTFASDFCSTLGDCGIKQNYQKQESNSGFFETDPKYNPEASNIGPAFFSLNRDYNPLVTTEEKETITLIPALISAWLNYMDDMANKRRTITDFAFCTLWQAPLENQKCNSCEQSEFCSEYKCRSLGRDCLYKEENGFPKCITAPRSESSLEIYFDSNYSFKQSSIDIAEKTLTGFEIEEPLLPYKPIDFVINTSAPTVCKITYMPELKFTETPAIWFGEPEFSYMHNVTFRLPDRISVPGKLYSSMNITSIGEIFNFVAANESKISQYFDADFSDMLNRFTTYVASRNYILGLLNLTISGLDTNTYYTFIRCSDDSGNENYDPVYIKFTIDNKSENADEAHIIAAYPRNNSIIQNQSYLLKIYLDEPAECMFSSQDESFLLMPYDLDCQLSGMRMSYYAGGSYECSAVTDILQPYIRCMDNPPVIKKYSFSISTSLNQTPIFYSINGSNVLLAEDLLYNNTIVYLENIDALYNLSLFMSENYSCRIGFNGFNINTMYPIKCSAVNESSENIAFGNYQCFKEIVPGNADVFLLCNGPEPTGRYISTGSYYLNYSLSKDLSILSAFPQTGQDISGRIVTVGVVVNKDITENSITCGYSLDNVDEFYQMQNDGSYQFKRTIYNLLPGSHTIQFHCKDKNANTDTISTYFGVE